MTQLEAFGDAVAWWALIITAAAIMVNIIIIYGEWKR